MRNFLALSIIALSIACSNSSVNTDGMEIPIDENGAIDSSRLAIIRFENEVFDFGQIKEGEKVAYTFNFTNTGTVPLIIASAQASCGCTVPKVADEPIAPGEKGKIEVVFNSENRMGLQNKTITVLSNTIPKEHQVYLRGEVLPKTIN